MKHLTCVLGLLWFLSSCGATLAADTELESFENSLYGVSEISHFHSDPAELARLSTTARSEVIRAKSVLMTVLKSLQDKSINSHGYLTEAFIKKFPTARAFAQSLLEQETSLIAIRNPAESRVRLETRQH